MNRILNKPRLFIAMMVLVHVPAQADVTLEQQITIEARGLASVFESERTRLSRISGDRARIEGFDGERAGKPEDITIINIERDTASMLYPASKEYETHNLKQVRIDAERDIALIEEMPVSGPDALPISEQLCQWGPPRIEMERTRKKAKIGGMSAEQHLVTVVSTCTVPDTRQACDVTWVLDYWNARRLPGDHEINDFRRRLANRLGTTELLALAPVIPQGLLALFESQWEEAMYEAEGLKGFPVKTVMSLHIGGEDCRTRSDKELTQDSVWTQVKKDSVQATKNSAAATAGSVVAGEVMRQVGGNIGGMIAGGAADILTRNAANKAMNKEPEAPGAVNVGDEGLAERIDGQVQIFRITTELKSLSSGVIAESQLQVPDGWQEITEAQ